MERQLLAYQFRSVRVFSSNMHHVEDNRGELEADIRIGDPIELRIQQFKGEAARTSQLEIAQKCECLIVKLLARFQSSREIIVTGQGSSAAVENRGTTHLMASAATVIARIVHARLAREAH